jgi:hypothetical protein
LDGKTRLAGSCRDQLFACALTWFSLLTLSVVGDYFTPWTDQAFMIGVGAIMLF